MLYGTAKRKSTLSLAVKSYLAYLLFGMYFDILMKSSSILSICRLRLILAKQICFQDLKSDSSLNEQSLDLETRYTLWPSKHYKLCILCNPAKEFATFSLE